MIEQVRRKLNWSSLNRFEQVALISSILVWVGVVLFGGGLYLAFHNYGLEQTAYAEATSIASLVTETIAPSPTTVLFPAGWSTATPTVTPTPTSMLIATRIPENDQLDETRLQPGSLSTPTILTTPQPLLAPQATLQPARAPRTAEGNEFPPPASQPPDRLVIPAIELDSSIVPIGWYVVKEGTSRYSIWQVADYAVSWHKTSAYPGHTGNVVLNGHHNIKGEVFRYLVSLEVGDRVLVYVEDQVYYYAVTEKHILKEKDEPPDVRRENAKWIAPTDDERLTMVTCWPYTDNTHRLVVVAKPILPPRTEGLEE